MIPRKTCVVTSTVNNSGEQTFSSVFTLTNYTTSSFKFKDIVLEEPVSHHIPHGLNYVKGPWGPNFTLQQLNVSVPFLIILNPLFGDTFLFSPKTAPTTSIGRNSWATLLFDLYISSSRAFSVPRLDVDDARGTDRCAVSGRKSSVETPAPGELVYFDRRVASRVYFRWSWSPHGSCRNYRSRGTILWSIPGEPQVSRVELTL